MIRSILYIATITLFIAVLPLLAQGQGVITIRLSYKVVLNPADGSRPTGPRGPRGGAVTDADIDAAIAAMNTLNETYFRGFRFQRIDPVTNVGGRGDNTGPSRWFNTGFDGNLKDQMEAAARDDARYAWNNNAINLYITNGICGGICSFPDEGDNIIIIGGCFANHGPLQLHEIGHYFNLCHTQGCFCAAECTAPGDDGIADTLPDLANWDRDQIAQNSFRLPYSNLSPAQQNQVDNVFFNTMSYHDMIVRLTELQLDRWTDAARQERLRVVDGRIYFVAVNAIFYQNGSSVLPYRTVQAAVNAAAASRNLGAILMLRPGAYNERLTIRTPLTLRATRTGPVLIGAATAITMQAEHFPAEIEKKLKGWPGIFGITPAQLDFPGKGSKQQ